MPFANATIREIKFQKHGQEFNAADAVTYEQIADTFLFGARDADTRECVRVFYSHRLRFKDSNRHFGVARAASNQIKTFYLVSQSKVSNRGGCAMFFTYECGRNDL